MKIDVCELECKSECQVSTWVLKIYRSLKVIYMVVISCHLGCCGGFELWR